MNIGQCEPIMVKTLTFKTFKLFLKVLLNGEKTIKDKKKKERKKVCMSYLNGSF